MTFADAITAGAHIYHCERFFDCVSLRETSLRMTKKWSRVMQAVSGRLARNICKQRGAPQFSAGC
jgi:hypothetical protein